ncbi:hypothetical protein BGZ74_000700 [Mortierella antarctica]|nr:hypothetical protein BGZ74_000700 [Mortierella antarctica]
MSTVMGYNAKDISFFVARLSMLVTFLTYGEKRFQRMITFPTSLFISVASTLISEVWTMAPSIVSFITLFFFDIVTAITNYISLSIFYYTIPSTLNSVNQQWPTTATLLNSLFASIFANLPEFIAAGTQHTKVFTPDTLPKAPSPVLNYPAITLTSVSRTFVAKPLASITLQPAALTRIAPKSLFATPTYRRSGSSFASATTTTLTRTLSHSLSWPLSNNSVPLSLALIQQVAPPWRTSSEAITRLASTTSRNGLQPPTWLLIQPAPSLSQAVLETHAPHLNQPLAALPSIPVPYVPNARSSEAAPKAARPARPARPARKRSATKAAPRPCVKVVMRRAAPASRSDSYSNKKLILNVPASKRTDVGQKFDTNIDESLDSDVEDRSSTESSDMDIDEEYDGQEPMDVDEEAEDDGCEPMDIDSDEMDIDSRADPDEDVDMLDISNWGIAFNTITTTATINTTNTISTLFQSAPVLPPSTAPRATPAPAPWRPRPFSHARTSRTNVYGSTKATQQHKTTSSYARIALPLKRTDTCKKPLRR